MSNNSKRSKPKRNEAGNAALQRHANRGRISLRMPAKFKDNVDTWIKLAESSKPLREMITNSDDDHSDHTGQGKDSKKITKSMIMRWLALVGQYRTIYDYSRHDAQQLLADISDHQRSEYRLEMIRVLDHFNPDILLLMHLFDPNDEELHCTIVDGYLRDHFLIAPPDPECFDQQYRRACTVLSMASERMPHPDDNI